MRLKPTAAPPTARGDKPAARTPLPWRVEPDELNYSSLVVSPGGGRVAYAGNDDAAFIVGAVNSHDALVAALRDAVQTVAGLYDPADGDDPAPLALARWRAVLALAERGAE